MSGKTEQASALLVPDGHRTEATIGGTKRAETNARAIRAGRPFGGRTLL